MSIRLLLAVGKLDLLTERLEPWRFYLQLVFTLYQVVLEQEEVEMPTP